MSRLYKLYEDMFKRDDIPDKVKDFEVVLKRSSIAIDFKMIKQSPSLYINEVGGHQIDNIEN